MKLVALAREAVATPGNEHETAFTRVSSLATKVTVAAFLVLSSAAFFITAAKIDPNAQLTGREIELPNIAVPP
jgi:hypothetical protein